MNLNKYHVYLKLAIDGVTSDAFSATGLPPIAKRTDSAKKVINVSRERYSKDRKVIEEKVLRWSGAEVIQTEAGEKIKTKSEIEGKPLEETAKKRKKPLYKYTCDNCGKEQELAIQLDPSRPIYCQDCLDEMKKTGKKPRKDIKKNNPKPIANDITKTPLVTKDNGEEEVSLKELNNHEK